jgi:hypothetical protein
MSKQYGIMYGVLQCVFRFWDTINVKEKTNIIGLNNLQIFSFKLLIRLSYSLS